MLYDLCWIIRTITAHVLMSTDIRKYKCMICFVNEHYRITPFFWVDIATLKLLIQTQQTKLALVSLSLNTDLLDM